MSDRDIIERDNGGNNRVLRENTIVRGQVRSIQREKGTIWGKKSTKINKSERTEISVVLSCYRGVK